MKIPGTRYGKKCSDCHIMMFSISVLALDSSAHSSLLTVSADLEQPHPISLLKLTKRLLQARPTSLAQPHPLSS
jgi:hypothetical protein